MSSVAGFAALNLAAVATMAGASLFKKGVERSMSFDSDLSLTSPSYEGAFALIKMPNLQVQAVPARRALGNVQNSGLTDKQRAKLQQTAHVTRALQDILIVSSIVPVIQHVTTSILPKTKTMAMSLGDRFKAFQEYLRVATSKKLTKKQIVEQAKRALRQAEAAFTISQKERLKIRFVMKDIQQLIQSLNAKRKEHEDLLLQTKSLTKEIRDATKNFMNFNPNTELTTNAYNQEIFTLTQALKTLRPTLTKLRASTQALKQLQAQVEKQVALVTASWDITQEQLKIVQEFKGVVVSLVSSIPKSYIEKYKDVTTFLQTSTSYEQQALANRVFANVALGIATDKPANSAEWLDRLLNDTDVAMSATGDVINIARRLETRAPMPWHDVLADMASDAAVVKFPSLMTVIESRSLARKNVCFVIASRSKILATSIQQDLAAVKALAETARLWAEGGLDTVRMSKISLVSKERHEELKQLIDDSLVHLETLLTDFTTRFDSIISCQAELFSNRAMIQQQLDAIKTNASNITNASSIKSAAANMKEAKVAVDSVHTSIKLVNNGIPGLLECFVLIDYYVALILHARDEFGVVLPRNFLPQTKASIVRFFHKLQGGVGEAFTDMPFERPTQMPFDQAYNDKILSESIASYAAKVAAGGQASI